MTATNLPYSVSVLADKTSPGYGTVFVHDSGSQPAVTLSSCGIASGCTFSVAEKDEHVGGGATELAKLSATGGGPATLTATEAKLKSSFFCGSTAKWSGVYAVESPASAFLVNQEATKLCKKSTVDPCGEAYPKDTILEATGPTTFGFKHNNVLQTVKCNKGVLSGKTNAEAGAPLRGEVGGWTFAECPKSCSVSSNLATTPAEMDLAAIGKGNGLIGLRSQKGKLFEFTVKCTEPTAFECVYRKFFFAYEKQGMTVVKDSTMTGGEPATWAGKGFELEFFKGDKCGMTSSFEFSYTFAKPETGGKAKAWLSLG